jgi:hypothetical protein
MKKALLMTFVALAALTLGLSAQDVSFDSLMSNLPKPSAAVPAVGETAVVSVQPVDAAPARQREWLVMVFINGVNDLGILGYANKSVNDMEKVGSTDQMAIVVEYGILGIDNPTGRNLSFQRGAKTIFVTKDADPDKITSLPFYSSNDADMGSAANLVRFAKRGIRKFPAQKVALVVWNHGGGRLGISYDDVSQNHMEVDQLGAALAQVKQALGHKIDVFATDACLMQMSAVAYELKDSAKVIVGSEETVPGDSYPYDTILGPLAANPGMEAEALGALMVDAYGAHYGDNVTLSALRSSALPGFTGMLNKWVNAVKADPKAFKAATSKGVVDATYNFEMEDSKDLYDYISNVNNLLTASPAAKQAGAALRSYMTGNLIINATKMPSLPKAHGLAIYIPALRYNSANYEKLAFARDSLWDDYLRDMMEVRLKP